MRIGDLLTKEGSFKRAIPYMRGKCHTLEQDYSVLAYTGQLGWAAQVFFGQCNHEVTH